ncbi:MAG: hypothetical protein M0R18_12955 [Deltaproteobacteria bacterium]|jgi:hypothetical protein|nr:hypothetical protein [Deltaproteobacteria bacterium]
MAELTANQESLVELMTKSDEHAQRGFQLIISKPGAEDFFDAINAAGLFAPDKAPGPVPADEPGYVHIPYWPPLDYLLHLAKLSGEREDAELAEKVMGVVRGVSRFRDEGEIRDNYHTYRIFAEIIGLVPRGVLQGKDIDLIPGWLDGKFDRSLVGSELSKGLIANLLESETQEDWETACTVLGHCTALIKGDDVPRRRRNKDLATVVDGYFLKGIIEKYAEPLGRKVGRLASSLFVNRIKEAFDGDALPSYMRRPAIEEHEQNRSWHEAENCLVEGLRDILLSWISTDPERARVFVAEMLGNHQEIIRRIGIYLLGERWDELEALYGEIVGPDLFDSRYIHEMYQLLNRRFGVFTEGDKEATVTAIRDLPLPEIDDDPEGYRRYIQRNWLSAIKGKGFQPADEWFAELNQEEGIGRVPDHPDFHYYMETGWGPGPSPYEVDELLAFAEGGSLIKKLNEFEQGDAWRGPSEKALVTVLENAVVNQPELFLKILSQFLDAKRSYQYGVINGFKTLWGGGDYDKVSFDWDYAWEQLIGFFENLIFDSEFWRESVEGERDLTPTRDWIPPEIAEFLRSGIRDDEKSYAPELLPRSLELIKALLDNLEVEDDSGRDAMSHAINSSRGKTLEALFSHALRACRVQDKDQGDHAAAWAELMPIFGKELGMCQEGTNYDFSTLAGAYLVNLSYLDKDWLHAEVDKIFPAEQQENFRCAISGLTYASATKDSYQLLVSGGIIDRALDFNLEADQVRERIVERVALAYLWGDEVLDSPRFSSFRSEDKIEDLNTISHFFWSVRDQGLSEDQVSLILDFLEWSIELAVGFSAPPATLFSSLSQLSCFLEEIGERTRPLLLAVAPYVSVNHNADDFIEELARLVEASPGPVSEILGVVLENYNPSYDYQDCLKGLLEKLVQTDFRAHALEYMNRVSHLKGVEALYRESM